MATANMTVKIEMTNELREYLDDISRKLDEMKGIPGELMEAPARDEPSASLLGAAAVLGGVAVASRRKLSRRQLFGLGE